MSRPYGEDLFWQTFILFFNHRHFIEKFRHTIYTQKRKQKNKRKIYKTQKTQKKVLIRTVQKVDAPPIHHLPENSRSLFIQVEKPSGQNRHTPFTTKQKEKQQRQTTLIISDMGGR